MARAGPAPAGESTVRAHNPAIAPLIGSGGLLVGRATPSAAAEPSWDDAPEPGLHRLLADPAREAREHPPCAPEGGVEPRPQARQSAADTGKRSGDAPGRYRRADRERQAHDGARPPP